MSLPSSTSAELLAEVDNDSISRRQQLTQSITESTLPILLAQEIATKAAKGASDRACKRVAILKVEVEVARRHQEAVRSSIKSAWKDASARLSPSELSNIRALVEQDVAKYEARPLSRLQSKKGRKTKKNVLHLKGGELKDTIPDSAEPFRKGKFDELVVVAVDGFVMWQYRNKKYRMSMSLVLQGRGGVVVGEPTGSSGMRLAGSDIPGSHHAWRALLMRSPFGEEILDEIQGQDENTRHFIGYFGAKSTKSRISQGRMGNPSKEHDFDLGAQDGREHWQKELVAAAKEF
ncbi:hypothetical protein EV421DRAFT_2015750 [Armillaria borealis]|uniref:Uncharacterized protein n=1 Tax=Armillaria borealis TaxID=47425 RepID=A0AA39MYY6_9AGAR|nr:hypothetical protein EV421DRAFT_2015750 [Armillaria borealis]